MAVTVPYVLAVTAVEAEPEEANAIPPLEELQDEKTKGPVGELERAAATPASSQPSSVGDANETGTVPDLVVRRVQGPPVPVMVAPETDPPAQLLEA